MDGGSTATEARSEVANRKIGFLPFIENDQIERARDNFRARTDAANTGFSLAGRARSPSLYVRLVKEAREASESLAEAAAVRGIHLPKIRELTVGLFKDCVDDIRYICRSDVECLAAVDYAATEAQSYLNRQLSINHTHASDDEIKLWIENSSLKNQEKAWTAFHNLPDFHSVTKVTFLSIWRQVFPERKRGRPRVQ